MGEVGSVGQSERLVCVGVIVGAHGVRGLVRVRAYTEVPEAVAAYGPLVTENGERMLQLTVSGRGPKGLVLATVTGIDDRNGAEKLKGERLYVPRGRLPAPDDADEYYQVDLIGLAARSSDGRPLGTVHAIYDFGGGDVIEITDDGHAPLVVPFTRDVVPIVDIAGGTLTVDPSAGLLDERQVAP